MVKKTTIGMLCLAAIGMLASAGLVSAFGGAFWGTFDGRFAGELASGQQRPAIEQAVENDDFEAWKAAVTETLTQENFDKLVARNKAMAEQKELQDAVRQAIAAGDYDAYKKAFENLMGSYKDKVMSEDDFNALVERYNSGEFNAGEVVKGFGFPGRGFGRHHMPW